MQSKPMTESEVAKWVGKDKKLEWMPVNPYSTNRNDFGEDYHCTLVRWHQLKASLVVK